MTQPIAITPITQAPVLLATFLRRKPKKVPTPAPPLLPRAVPLPTVAATALSLLGPLPPPLCQSPPIRQLTIDRANGGGQKRDEFGGKKRNKLFGFSSKPPLNLHFQIIIPLPPPPTGRVRRCATVTGNPFRWHPSTA